MFEITEFTEAHLASVTNRQEAHGDEQVPAVSVGLELTTGNMILDRIDATLREALFKRDEAQAQLPGVDITTPVLRCNSIDRVLLPTKHEGWTLEIESGFDDTRPMTLGGVKVDKFSVQPMQGGSIVLRLRVGTNDVDADRLGQLGMRNGHSIWVRIVKPEIVYDPVSGGPVSSGAPDATDLFAGNTAAQE